MAETKYGVAVVISEGYVIRHIFQGNKEHVESSCREYSEGRNIGRVVYLTDNATQEQIDFLYDQLGIEIKEDRAEQFKKSLEERTQRNGEKVLGSKK